MVTVVKDTKFDEFLEFPCAFTFKVLGVAHEDLVPQVIAALCSNMPVPMIMPQRSNHPVKAITIQYQWSVTVRDKDHIELLYTELGRLELVRYVM